MFVERKKGHLQRNLFITVLFMKGKIVKCICVLKDETIGTVTKYVVKLIHNGQCSADVNKTKKN